MIGIINNTIKQKKVKCRLRLSNAFILPILLYDSECWTIKAKAKSRRVAADMKFMRKTLVYNWTDHKTNPKVFKLLKNYLGHRENKHALIKWTNHVNRKHDF